MTNVLIIMFIVAAILFLLSRKKAEQEEPPPAKDLLEHFYKENTLPSIYQATQGDGIIKTTKTSSRILSHKEIDRYETGIIEGKRINPVNNSVESFKTNYGLKFPCGHVLFNTSTASLTECYECKALVCSSTCSKQCAGCQRFFCHDHCHKIVASHNGKMQQLFFCKKCLDEIIDNLGEDNVKKLDSGSVFIEDQKKYLEKVDDEQNT